MKKSKKLKYERAKNAKLILFENWTIQIIIIIVPNLLKKGFDIQDTLEEPELLDPDALAQSALIQLLYVGYKDNELSTNTLIK